MDIRKIIAMLLIATMTTAMATTSFAVNQETNQNTPTIDTTEVAPAYLEKYNYYWKIESSSPISTGYGNWRTGPSGMGPGTVSMNQKKSFSPSFSGEIPIGIGPISLKLGFNINSSKEHVTGYSIRPPQGQRYTIMYRPQTTVYKVVQGYYRHDNYTGKITREKTATAYVTGFRSWDYTYRNDSIVKISLIRKVNFS